MGSESVSIQGWLQALFAFVATALALAVFAPLAEAETSFCPEGSGSGQCERQQGVAVDSETGRVYVADLGNNRIDVFEADGSFVKAFGWGVADGVTEASQSCTTTCFKGISGTGAGQFVEPRGIAVDNDPSSGSRHDIYVFDGGLRVQKFDPEGKLLLSFGEAGEGNGQFSTSVDPIAVGPGGVVYVGDTKGFNEAARVEKFDSAGSFLEAVPLEHSDRLNGAIAVDSTGDIYATFNAAGGVFKFHPNGKEYGAPYPLDNPSPVANGLAVGESDELFASQVEDGANPSKGYGVITEYDATGNRLSRFGYGRLEVNVPSLAAFQSAGGDVFASNGRQGIRYLALPAPGPIVPVESLVVEDLRNTKATLSAEINPEGDPTEFHFDYVDDEHFQKEGGFNSPATKSTEPKALSIPSGKEFSVQLAEVVLGCPNATKQLIEEGKCLVPETTYHFRVVATNAKNPEGKGEATAVGPTFTTKKPLEIEALFATEVGTDAATLHAKVDPLGIPTMGYFEYVDDASFQESEFADATRIPDVDAEPPEAEIDFGSGESAVSRTATLAQLTPGTTYHYRLKAIDPLIDEPLTSEAKTFTTFEASQPESCSTNEASRIGPSALLPDCRAYEMVSPLDKDGGDIHPLEETFTGRLAVLAESSVSGGKLAYGSYNAFGDAQSALFTNQYVAARGTEAWSSHTISPPRTKRVVGTLEAADTEFKFFSPDLCQSWLRTYADPPLAEGATEGYSNLYHRQDQDPECGGLNYKTLTSVVPPNVAGESFGLELQGVSTDLSHTVFRANDNLTGSEAAQPAKCVKEGVDCEMRLYESDSEGQLRFICVLPGGKATAGTCTAGKTPLGEDQTTRRASVTNAISADGSRVFWTAGPEQGKIFVRENAFGEGPECSEASSPCTIPVSTTAELLSAAKGAQYWTAADDGSKAVFSTGNAQAGVADLYEFSVGTKTTRLIAHKVFGLLGASEDASRIYLVSSEALAVGAEAGAPNLYFYEAGEGGGTFTFVATLSAADAALTPSTGRKSSAVAAEAWLHSSRVSADGLHATFMSSASPTGYDNVDANSGEDDTEVYLYDASAGGGAGKLICASCNPSGARPIGENVGREGGAGDKSFWTAASTPVWENTLYASRVLSEDGKRLFFDSFDALVPNDTNGRQDVYEWEQLGTGGCDEEDATFVSSSGGCVDLISSGQSIRDSEFVDASPNGDDVFFATLSSLLPQDYGLIDIYDARVNGGLPIPPPEPFECEGEVCQHPPPAPQDPTPSSLSYVGPGNSTGAKPKKPCPKGKVRSKGKCVKKKAKGQGHPKKAGKR